MPLSIREQADNAAIEQVKAEKPSSFTVGGSFDGKQAIGGISYNRTWKNGWGATAYLRAWYHDAPIVPTDKFGFVVGAEVTKRL